MSGDIAEQTAPYEYMRDPIIINTERHKVSWPNRMSHRLRVPTLEQWLVWGHEIYEERRYLSKQELEEKNRLLGREEPEEPVEYAYQHHFNEYDASRRLYKAIAIDATLYESNEQGELEPVETRPITEELLQEAILNPDVVIGGLYCSYCELEESTVSQGAAEIRVRQTIGSSDSAPSVVHVFRKASDEEIQQFQNDSLRAYGVPGKADTQRICLNLRVADDLYDELVIRIENATVNGQEYNDSTRADFLRAINPVYKFKTLEAALQINLLDFAGDFR